MGRAFYDLMRTGGCGLMGPEELRYLLTPSLGSQQERR